MNLSSLEVKRKRKGLELAQHRIEMQAKQLKAMRLLLQMEQLQQLLLRLQEILKVQRQHLKNQS